MLNAAYLHLAMNHIPIVGVMFGLILLVVALFRKSDEFLRASLTIFLLAALFAIPTFLSGNAAEDIVETLPSVIKDYIESHESMALFSLIAIEILGLFSLISLILFRKRSFPSWSINLFLILSMITAGLLGFTAKLGGEIHHPEARPTFHTSLRMSSIRIS